MEQLIELPTKELLLKFGKGNHKPGSGTAAALQGMLSAQLIRTVINLTSDEKRGARYKQWLTELSRIDTEISTRIYPALEQLFQQDSEQFDKVIQLREARDKEQSPSKKAKLKEEVKNATIPAIEIPLKIAKLCVKLSNFAVFLFDNGFQSARGDSGVALNNAVSAIAGCLSIVNLNLLSLSSNELTKKIIHETSILKSIYQELLSKTTQRLQNLEEDVAFHTEIELLRSNLWLDSSLSNTDIETIARQLQNTLWIYRQKLWPDETPEDPIDILKPEIILTKILGYKLNQQNTLGEHNVNGESFEIAGIIDKQKKSVTISEQFSIQTQNFTLAHEIGHALFHKQNVLHRDRALDDAMLVAPRDIKEFQADKFASYLLMPSKQVKTFFTQLFLTERFVINEPAVFALTGGRTSTVSSFKKECKDLRGLSRLVASTKLKNRSTNEVISIAEKFGVSIETMAIRLEELQLIEF